MNFNNQQLTIWARMSEVPPSFRTAIRRKIANKRFVNEDTVLKVLKNNTWVTLNTAYKSLLAEATKLEEEDWDNSPKSILKIDEDTMRYRLVEVTK